MNTRRATEVSAGVLDSTSRSPTLQSRGSWIPSAAGPVATAESFPDVSLAVLDLGVYTPRSPYQSSLRDSSLTGCLIPALKCSRLLSHRPYGTQNGQTLGARPRIRRGRVPSAAGADARRRDAGDVGVHRRGAPTPQMPPRRRNPKGAWGLRGDLRVARRQRCTTTSPPPRALSSPCKPHARDPS